MLRLHHQRSAPAPVVIVQAAVLLVALIAASTVIHLLFAAAPLTVATANGGSGPTVWLPLLDAALMLDVGYLVALFVGGIWIVNALHRGQPMARLVLSTLPVLDLIMIVATGSDPVSRLVLTVHLGIAALLWLPGPAREHFQLLHSTSETA